MSKIRTRTIKGLKTGDTFTISRTFTEQDVSTFADITRDYNPIHFDERFTGVKNLKGRICHGLLVGSLLTEVGGQIGWLASKMDFRFQHPVYFGDTVTCDLTITEIDSNHRARATARFTNQDGTVVLEAELGGILPGESERQVLKTMVVEGDPTNMPVKSLNSSVLKWPDKNTVDQAVRSWSAEQGRQRSGLRKLGYFGSYARGDWGVGSDLDLVAIVDDTAKPFERRALNWDLNGFPVPAELLVYTTKEWNLMQKENEKFIRALNKEVIWTYLRDS